jgi:hypothetical protein
MIWHHITREELLRRKQSKDPSLSTADGLSFLETLRRFE